jgi:ferritin-like metal-binding protein YciE
VSLTKSHVERLEQVFEDINEKPKGKTCHGIKGLIEEGSEILQEEGEESVIDAGIIVAAQKVEHYAIAGYGSVRTLLSCSARRDPLSFSKTPSMRNPRRMRRSTNWLKRS